MPPPRRNISVFAVPSLFSAVTLSSLISCMTLACLGGCNNWLDVTFPNENPNDPNDPNNPNDDPNLNTGSCAPIAPTLRRLNRTELTYTLRDLLFLDENLVTSAVEQLPVDGVGYGFDNNGDVLSVSPLFVEKYQTILEDLVARAVDQEYVLEQRFFEAESLSSAQGVASPPFWNLFVSGSIGTEVQVPAGTYIIRVAAAEQAAGDEHAQMQIQWDGRVVATFAVSAPAVAPDVYETTITTTAGTHTVAATFTNDFWDPDNPAGEQDRNLLVDRIEVHGPTGTTAPQLTACADLAVAQAADRTNPATLAARASCSREIATRFATQAFRRPVDEEQLTSIVSVAAQIDAHSDLPYSEGLKLMLRRILSSPYFLFRPESTAPTSNAGVALLDDYSLATRLSYFLWSTSPDEILLQHAHNGDLHDGDVLLAEIDRMLQDPRSDALVRNFAEQWLTGRALLDAVPDSRTFADFTPAVRTSMLGESFLFLREFMRSDENLLDAINADFTYIDENLAAYYGLSWSVENPVPFDVTTLPAQYQNFRRASLTDTDRRGFLTQGALLTATSYPLRTSPVKRGKWVLEQLLCMPPPPPPANVVNSLDSEAGTGTVRQRLEEHRRNPDCAACHELMDPIGFGLEKFGPTGQFRTLDDGQAINDADVFLGTTSFQGAPALAEILRSRPEVGQCLSEKMLTYALGRGIARLPSNESPEAVSQAANDACIVDAVHAQFAAGGYKMRDLVRAIVENPAFLYRPAE